MRSQVVFFTNSGTEANELAMMIARLYTGSHDIISLRNAYHGNAAGTMGATASSNWKFNVVQVTYMHTYSLVDCNTDNNTCTWSGYTLYSYKEKKKKKRLLFVISEMNLCVSCSDSVRTSVDPKVSTDIICGHDFDLG